ncbi:MAG: hypothetical protein K6A74_07725 [Lachnospiraceae bacterium]|nr:hypothetical protein [Lachnospiraceae bacterium]
MRQVVVPFLLGFMSILAACDMGKRTETNNDLKTELLPIEERLLVQPGDDDIPKSIKEVFTNNSKFAVVHKRVHHIDVAKTCNGDIDITVSYEDVSLFGGLEVTDIRDYSTLLEWYKDGELPENDTYLVPSEKLCGNLYWIAYSVIDLDGDGINELVYKLGDSPRIDGSFDYGLIFHELNGEIYAYCIGNELSTLREDGTFLNYVEQDLKATNWRISSFDEKGYNIECEAVSYFSDHNWNNLLLCIGGKNVTYAEYTAYDRSAARKRLALFRYPAEYSNDDATITNYIDETVLPIEERLLLCPVGEAIPKSIEDVFAENKVFTVIHQKRKLIMVDSENKGKPLNVLFADIADGGAPEKVNIQNYLTLTPWYYEEKKTGNLFWYGYAVVDLNSDGINELIFSVGTDRIKYDECVDDNTDYYLVFYEYHGEVYAYCLDYYEAESMYEDGTISRAIRDDTYNWKIESFNEEGIDISFVSYMYYDSDAGGEIAFINNQPVSYNAYMDFDNAFSNKPRLLFKWAENNN